MHMSVGSMQECVMNQSEISCGFHTSLLVAHECIQRYTHDMYTNDMHVSQLHAPKRKWPQTHACMAGKMNNGTCICLVT